MNTSTDSSISLDALFLQDVSSIIKTLGHPDRIRIIELIYRGERSVTEIYETLEMSQSSVSQHLRRMYREGILSSRRDGNSVFYSTTNPLIGRMLGCLAEVQDELMAKKEMNR